MKTLHNNNNNNKYNNNNFLPHLSFLSKLKFGTHKNETQVLSIIAKITDALNPSLLKEYCENITEIIRHDVTKT